MSRDTFEIRGLRPWIESGELTAILLAVSIWFEATDCYTRVHFEFKFWEVDLGGDNDLRPCLDIRIGWSRERVGRAACQVRAWEGAVPADVIVACRDRLKAVKKAAKQCGGSRLVHIPCANVEVVKPGRTGD